MRLTSLYQRPLLTSRRQTVLGCVALLVAISSCWAQVPAVLTSAIPRQPLAQALTAFAAQTSLQLIYVSDLASGRFSQNVPAGLPVAEALGRMLEGTGLRFDFLNPRTVRLLRVAEVSAAPEAASPVLTEPPVQRRANSAPETLDDILVTATKREEFLSAVPLSANVLTAAAMEASGVKSVSEVAALTPGVEFEYVTNFGSGIRKNISIRGVNSYVGMSTTAIYIDDTPIQALNRNFGSPYPLTFDLDRVEVLRGPQGTLFGASAEGGAVRFITREPSMTSDSGLIRTEIGTIPNGGVSYEVGAAAGGPLVPDSVGFRVSGWYRSDAGSVDRVNPFTGAVVDRNASRSLSRSASAALNAAPTSATRVTATLAHQSVGIHDSPDFYTYLSNPDIGVLKSGKLLAQPAADSFYLATVKLNARLASGELTSVTSYFDRTGAAAADFTNLAGAVYFGGYGNPLGTAYPASSANAVPTQVTLHQVVLSQEFRLASSDDSRRLTGVAGVFFSRARQEDTQTLYAPAVSNKVAIYSDDNDTNTQVAAFGQAEFKIAPQFKASAGLRVARTIGAFAEHAGGFAYVGIPEFSSHVAAETPLTPKVGLSFQTEHRSLYYATIAKGYRNGDVNVPVASQCLQTVPSSYGSDEVWSYEIGAKNTTRGGSVQLDTSVFHLSWRNLQQSGTIPSCGFGYVLNAGNAISNGFDLALRALITSRLKTAFAIGYTNVYFARTVISRGLIIADKGTAVGGLPTVPSPWIVTASTEYRFPIGATLVGHLRAEDIFHSRNPGPFTENDPASINYWPTLRADPSTNEVNLRLGMTWSKFDLALFAFNALNAQPILQRNSDAPGSTLLYATTIRPRMIGATVSRQF